MQSASPAAQAVAADGVAFVAKTATKQETPAPPDGDRGTAVLNIKGLPQEVADRFRALATDGITQAEALGALVDMYDAGCSLDALQAQTSAAEARRSRAAEEARQAVAERDAARQESSAYRAAAREEAARQVGLSQAAIELLMSLVEMGASRDAIIRWGQALVAAKIEPEQAARVMERVGGLLLWAEQLQAGTEQLDRLREQADAELQASKRARAMVDAEAEAKAKAVAAIEQDIQTARAAVQRIESAGRELGLYVDFLSQTGARVEELPLGTAMAVAGVILFTALQNHAREKLPVLYLNPSMEARRPVRVPVLLAELPGLLAPPEVYGAVLRQTQEQAVMARELAAAPAAAPAEGGEG